MDDKQKKNFLLRYMKSIKKKTELVEQTDKKSQVGLQAANSGTLVVDNQDEERLTE